MKTITRRQFALGMGALIASLPLYRFLQPVQANDRRTWLIQAGYTPGKLVPPYAPGYHGCPMGGLFIGADKVYSRLLLRDPYEWAKLSARVTVNTSSRPFVIESNINGLPGNQRITFSPGETGIKNDDIGIDSLVYGDLATWRYLVQDGQVAVSLVNSTLSTSGDDIPIIASLNRTFFSPGTGVKRFYPVVGELPGDPIEEWSQYPIFTPATYSNMRARIWANTYNQSTTVTFRNNGVDANQRFDIGAGVTGDVEDLVRDLTT